MFSRKSLKGTTWDEMNILATLHPADKDYGHMKIDEPKTPYNFMDADHVDGLNLAALEEKMRASGNEPPKALLGQDDSDDDDDLTPDEKAMKREFQNRRKKHYNEFYAVKLARKLLEEEDDSDTSPKGSPSPKQSPKHKAQNQSTSKH